MFRGGNGDVLSKASYEGAFQTNLVLGGQDCRRRTSGGTAPCSAWSNCGGSKREDGRRKKGQYAAASIGTSAKEGKEKTRPQYPLKEEKSDGDEVGGVIYEHKRCA